MVDDDRIKEDFMRDAFMKKIKELREIMAGYGQESRTETNTEPRRRAKLAYGLTKQIIDILEMQLQQIEQTNKISRTIIALRQEVEKLKSRI